ncbi:MAG: dihydrofolate reductase [Bacteroidia bacterium]|nr:dihydrofolate reductase [Bacteroidia bacterium]MBP7261242.1 dihydrofolate reductase [Bacteroidia bacterium]MBP9180202.1 dihydrofolate reductase [Bacteroidia bacterium]MBP9725176.1 dihydrofolate reductase [Bacteroidia bacterium]
MIISLIVAADEHNGIGKNNQLLCHLPADLKYFKQTTTGHHIVMGRKTYDSVGRPLPNRVNIVITRNSLLSIPGCVVVADLQQAISYAAENGETELFITGGGTIYEQAMGIANRIYLTRIHHNFEADTFFPAIEPTMWKELSSEFNEQDEKNKYDYTFQVLEKLS